MLNIFRHRVSPTLVVLLEQIGRGAHKRVDENRELLELLQSKVPHLLDECPWIVGWLRANDEVFVAMGMWETELRLLPPGMPCSQVIRVHGPSGVHQQTRAFRCVAPPGFAGFAPCHLWRHGLPAPILNAAARYACLQGKAPWAIPAARCLAPLHIRRTGGAGSVGSIPL